MTELWTYIAHVFDVNTIAFTTLGYPMSYVELIGTIFNLWSVVLVARNRILTWPVGIIGVVFFLCLFYQINLYSDTLEQVYYLIASVYGWWYWARRGSAERGGDQLMRFSQRRVLWVCIVATLALSVVLGFITSHLSDWMPAFFPTPASFAYLDALTTIMSFTATLLMAQRRIECWIYWISVDIIGIGLYYAKGVHFIAFLYVLFLFLAISGLVSWLGGRRERYSSVLA